MCTCSRRKNDDKPIKERELKPEDELPFLAIDVELVITERFSVPFSCSHWLFETPMSVSLITRSRIGPTIQIIRSVCFRDRQPGVETGLVYPNLFFLLNPNLEKPESLNSNPNPSGLFGFGSGVNLYQIVFWFPRTLV